MIRVAIIMLLAVVLPVGAQTLPGLGLRNPALLSPIDNSKVFRPPAPGDGYLKNYFQRALADPRHQMNLALRAHRLWGLERYELTRMESALYGADGAAFLGLFTAALGQFAGLWDERTSLYVVGAAAAAGAAWGGTLGHGQDEWRVRLRWQDDTRP